MTIKILKKIMNNILLVCIISSSFSILSLFYYSFIPKKYETFLTLDNNPLFVSSIDPSLINSTYESNILNNNTTINMKESLKIKLYSITFFNNFIKEKGLDNKLLRFSLNPMDQFSKSQLTNVYLVYDSNLGMEGPKLLNDYLNYIMEETKKDYKEQIKIILKNERSIFKNAYDKAIAIKLAYPVGLKKVNETLESKVGPININNELYTSGYIILGKQIDFIDIALLKIKDDVIKFDFIIDKATSIRPLLSKNLFIVIGFTLGFVLSILIILIKESILYRKDK